MLKVAPCTVGCTVVRSYGRTVVRSYGRTVVHPIFFRLDGLLLFCIITGLRPASSAITADTTWKLLVHVITVNNYFPFPEFFFFSNW